MRSADQSARSTEIFFTFIFQGWTIVEPSCFALCVPDGIDDAERRSGEG